MDIHYKVPQKHGYPPIQLTSEYQNHPHPGGVCTHCQNQYAYPTPPPRYTYCQQTRTPTLPKGIQTVNKWEFLPGPSHLQGYRPTHCQQVIIPTPPPHPEYTYCQEMRMPILPTLPCPHPSGHTNCQQVGITTLVYLTSRGNRPRPTHGQQVIIPTHPHHGVYITTTTPPTGVYTLSTNEMPTPPHPRCIHIANK